MEGCVWRFWLWLTPSGFCWFRDIMPEPWILYQDCWETLDILPEPWILLYQDSGYFIRLSKLISGSWYFHTKLTLQWNKIKQINWISPSLPIHGFHNKERVFISALPKPHTKKITFSCKQYLLMIEEICIRFKNQRHS